MPIIQVDWEKIKSRFAGGTQLHVFTDQQAALLLSLSEQLTWDKTYKVADYDFSDRDTLEAEVADTQRNLMMGVDLADLFGYIDDIETLLTDLKTLTSNQCCPGDEFDGGGNTDDVEDGVGDVPQNIIDAGYASGTSDWSGFDDYKCIISTLIVQDAIGKALKFSQLYDIQGAIIGGSMAVVGVITFLVTGGTLAILGGILAAAGAALGLWELLAEAGEESMESMHSNMQDHEDEFICAVYNADGPTAGIAALYAEYDVHLSAVEAAIAKLFNSLAIFRAMYGGRYNEVDVAQRLADQGYVSEDFECCPEEDIDDTGIYYNTVAGFNHSYDSENGWWEIDSVGSGCASIHIEWFSDASKTIRKAVRLDVLTCTGSPTSCGGVDQRRGHTYDGGWVQQYSGGHGVEDSSGIHRWLEVHQLPFTGIVTYRIFEP